MNNNICTRFEDMCLDAIAEGMEWDVIQEVSLSAPLEVYSSDKDCVVILCPVKVTTVKGQIFDSKYQVEVKAHNVCFDEHEPWRE